jgi:hypothetical protein
VLWRYILLPGFDPQQGNACSIYRNNTGQNALPLKLFVGHAQIVFKLCIRCSSARLKSVKTTDVRLFAELKSAVYQVFITFPLAVRQFYISFLFQLLFNSSSAAVHQQFTRFVS